jgi:hypothetical protein
MAGFPAAKIKIPPVFRPGGLHPACLIAPSHETRGPRFEGAFGHVADPGRHYANSAHGVGRSSGSRIVLLAAPSHSALTHRPGSLTQGRPPNSGYISGFRLRLQRRDRDGIAPSSLLAPLGHRLRVCITPSLLRQSLAHVKRIATKKTPASASLAPAGASYQSSLRALSMDGPE